MTSSVVAFYLTAFALGGAGMFVANRKLDMDQRRRRWVKFAAYFVITATVLAMATAGRVEFGALSAAIVALAARELYQLRRGLPAVVWAVYALVGAGVILFALTAGPALATFVYLVIAVFDGFSQVFGQLAGKRQIARRISPGKTVEGAVGGLLAAMAGAVLLRGWIEAPVGQAIWTCGAIVAAAFAGDLSASWVKRRQGVKDFGRWLPGHGGVLDRFDSFLAAAALMWLIQEIRTV